MMQVAEAQFVSMRPEHLDAVVAVEASAHSHPWGHAHFIEALQADNQAQLLMADGHLLGYFVAMPGVDEVHLLNITVAPRTSARVGRVSCWTRWRYGHAGVAQCKSGWRCAGAMTGHNTCMQPRGLRGWVCARRTTLRRLEHARTRW